MHAFFLPFFDPPFPLYSNKGYNYDLTLPPPLAACVLNKWPPMVVCQLPPADSSRNDRALKGTHNNCEISRQNHVKSKLIPTKYGSNKCSGVDSVKIFCDSEESHHISKHDRHFERKGSLGDSNSRSISQP